MRRMIHQHLLQRADAGAQAAAYLAGAHLDEDALSAFVEGRLSDAESTPIISHLVNCNSCRRFTAELVRLESETSHGEASAPPLPVAEPNRILARLKDLAARVLPASSEEVFAYHAPADDFERRTETEAAEQPAATEQSEQEDQTDRES